MRDRLSGNEAIAVAMRQIEPDVVAAFPITPSTEVPQFFSSFVADGKVNTEFVAVESEHSAMSACIGAQALGARAMTATASAGLALMWEMLYGASGSRLPIVMATVNRALSAPLNIHNDHSDSMGARDSGWIQIYSEDNQEAYDNFIMAVRIAEHEDVLLPAMVCYDGFVTSHSVETIDLIDDAKVKKFVGKYEPKLSLGDKKHPIAMGPLDLPSHFFEHKRQQAEAMRNAKKVAADVAVEFEKLTGRKYEYFEQYRLEDADVAVVILNATAGTAKDVVDQLRENGVKAGLLKIRMFRPFPSEEIAAALAHVKALAIMDKADGVNAAGGPVFTDVTSALAVHSAEHNTPAVKAINFIYGLGGRDVKADNIQTVYNRLLGIAESGFIGDVYNHLGVRE